MKTIRQREISRNPIDHCRVCFERKIYGKIHQQNRQKDSFDFFTYSLLISNFHLNSTVN